MSRFFLCVFPLACTFLVLSVWPTLASAQRVIQVANVSSETPQNQHPIDPALEIARSSLLHTQEQIQDYTALWVEGFVNQYRLISLFDCLDLIDKDALIRQISTQQVRPENTLAGRKPIPDRQAVQGLFHCCYANPIQDSYYALLALSLLDGLDQIDQAACVRGILRFHDGKGLFGSRKDDDSIHFYGDAQETFYAYESLRLLKALDQVKDLHKWAFRPRPSSHKITLSPDHHVTWREIEAWLFTRRLHTYIVGRRHDPGLRAPSLVDGLIGLEN